MRGVNRKSTMNGQQESLFPFWGPPPPTQRQARLVNSSFLSVQAVSKGGEQWLLWLHSPVLLTAQSHRTFQRLDDLQFGNVLVSNVVVLPHNCATPKLFHAASDVRPLLVKIPLHPEQHQPVDGDDDDDVVVVVVVVV